jgi:cell wall-associated NlpC family hydrolase
VAATLAALVIVTIQPPAPTAAASPAATTTPADRVIAAAMAERGSPWAYGATGPRAFDCSGLVVYSFGRAGVLTRIGSGHYRSGSAMLRWARAHHLARSTGHRGDVVVWGNGAHVGIYLGKGKAISTLTSGVRVHGLRVLNTRFTTFISTGLSGAAPAAATANAATTPAGPRPKVVGHRTVAVSRLNFRSAPRVTAAASRVLPRGARVGVIRAAKDAAGRTWYRVVVGTRVGWVAGWLTRPAP